MHVPKGGELEGEEERVDGWKKGSSTKGRNQEGKERVDGFGGGERRRNKKFGGGGKEALGSGWGFPLLFGCLAVWVFLFWVFIAVSG